MTDHRGLIDQARVHRRTQIGDDCVCANEGEIWPCLTARLATALESQSEVSHQQLCAWAGALTDVIRATETICDQAESVRRCGEEKLAAERRSAELETKLKVSAWMYERQADEVAALARDLAAATREREEHTTELVKVIQRAEKAEADLQRYADLFDERFARLTAAESSSATLARDLAAAREQRDTALGLLESPLDRYWISCRVCLRGCVRRSDGGPVPDRPGYGHAEWCPVPAALAAPEAPGRAPAGAQTALEAEDERSGVKALERTAMSTGHDRMIRAAAVRFLETCRGGSEMVDRAAFDAVVDRVVALTLRQRRAIYGPESKHRLGGPSTQCPMCICIAKREGT